MSSGITGISVAITSEKGERRNEYWRGSIKGKRNQSAVTVK